MSAVLPLNGSPPDVDAQLLKSFPSASVPDKSSQPMSNVIPLDTNFHPDTSSQALGAALTPPEADDNDGNCEGSRDGISDGATS
jgi:hypothetical protein